MKRQQGAQQPQTNSLPNDLAQKLRDARKAGNPLELAEALAAHASKLVQEGKFGFARAELDEAIEIHHNLGHLFDETRLTQFSATLSRMEGNLAESKRRAVQAINMAEKLDDRQGAGPIIVAASTELGESALAEGNGASAAYAFGQALEKGQENGLLPTVQSSLLRKRANAYALAGKFEDAASDLETAYGILIQEGETAHAMRTRIELISALMQSSANGSDQKSLNLIAETRFWAQSANDQATMAELDILMATRALNQKDAQAALAFVKSARKEALDGRAPLPYISAISIIAQLEESLGNQVNAYGTLATGWATLGDLLGTQVARATFEPLLNQMRERWGNAHFWEVKAAYEDLRRSAIADEMVRKAENDAASTGGAIK